MGALLRNVPLGFHVHLMRRGPRREVLTADVAVAEEEADRLAYELLAPAEAVLARAGGDRDGLALVLRKVEARGWTVELRGNDVRVATGLQTESARRAMEDDGIWHIVQLLVGRRGADLFTYR